jgi:SAM-dependent methyltransferase
MPIFPRFMPTGSQAAQAATIGGRWHHPVMTDDPWLALRLHEIAERDHRILNPFSAAKLRLVGELCRFAPGQRVLDLCCGKGELLCSWSRDHGVHGLGVDISPTFLTAARARAEELGVAGAVEFVEADASRFRPTERGFDAVCCIGATWIGGGLAGTLALLREVVRDDGLILVGEPYWRAPPEPDWEAMFGAGFTTLPGLLDVLEGAGVELVEMVLADGDDWDRYVAAQWWTADRWLREHPQDPLRPAMEEFLEAARRSHLAVGREQFGWGVFVLRPAA